MYRICKCVMQCDGCRALVHMECYGVERAPQGQSWLCDVCALGQPLCIHSILIHVTPYSLGCGASCDSTDILA